VRSATTTGSTPTTAAAAPPSIVAALPEMSAPMSITAAKAIEDMTPETASAHADAEADAPAAENCRKEYTNPSFGPTTGTVAETALPVSAIRRERPNGTSSSASASARRCVSANATNEAACQPSATMTTGPFTTASSARWLGAC
jgi:hypothetical protein